MTNKTIITAALLLSAAAASNAATNIIGDITTTKGPDFVGASSGLGNGDFQAQAATGAQPFSAIASWHNLSGAETVNFGNSNGTFGSPQSGSLGAFFTVSTLSANSTGYLIQAGDVGNTFAVNMYLGQFGNQGTYDGDEIVTASVFFITANPATGTVTDTTATADITNLNSLAINPFIQTGNPAFFNMAGGNIHTIVAGDVGKTVFLGLQLTNPTGAAVFPRLDVVSFAVVPEPSIALLGGLGLLGLLRRRRN